jgi:hypothetical protein
MSSETIASCERNILHVLDEVAAIIDYREYLFHQGELTPADDQILTERLQIAQNKFVQTRELNFELVIAEEVKQKNPVRLAENNESASSMEVDTAEMDEGKSWWVRWWNCFQLWHN